LMLSSSAYSLKPGSGGIEEVVKLGLSDDEGSQLEESANGAKIVEVMHG
jgi:hypothetical protein